MLSHRDAEPGSSLFLGQKPRGCLQTETQSAGYIKASHPQAATESRNMTRDLMVVM